MKCPQCLTRSIPVKRPGMPGYDPLMMEYECTNERCKCTFYITNPPWNPPDPIKEHKRNPLQSELIPH